MSPRHKRDIVKAFRGKTDVTADVNHMDLLAIDKSLLAVGTGFRKSKM